MVNDTGTPLQDPMLGVMVTVPTCWAATLAAVRLMFPLPEAGRPMAGLLFTQLNAAPVEPERLITMDWLAQIVMLAGRFTVGAGLTVIVNVCGGPGHPFWVGVTLMVPVCAAATNAAVKLMFPLPDAGNPMAVLLLVQE